MWMRIVGAAAVLVSAAVHLYLWFDGFRDLNIVGPAFLLNAVGGAVIAVLLVTWRSWVPALLTAGFGVSTLGAFILSTTVGLFGLHERWVGWPVWTAAVSIVVGTLLLVRDLPASSAGQLEHRPSFRRAHLH
jgi:hypothetical protein